MQALHRVRGEGGSFPLIINELGGKYICAVWIRNVTAEDAECEISTEQGADFLANTLCNK